jgi:hypothetical protein
MTPIELVTVLHTAGCRLIPEGEHLRVQDPQHALTDDLRQAIREHKPELLRLLAQTTPVHESPLAEAPVLRPPEVLYPSSQRSKDLETPPVTWRCPCCKRIRRWKSIYGTVICARCHPPADTELVAAWEGEA